MKSKSDQVFFFYDLMGANRIIFQNIMANSKKFYQIEITGIEQDDVDIELAIYTELGFRR